MADGAVPQSGTLRSRADRIARLGVALAVTAFIGYYMVDLARDPGMQEPWVAVLLWAASLAWIAVTAAVLDAHPAFGDGYYRLRPFERSGRLYRAMGVHYAVRLMPHGEYANRLARRVRAGSGPIRGPESAERWLTVTRSKEAAHLGHLLMTLPAIGVFLAGGWAASTACLVGLDVVGDLYPVLGQRYNRIRLERIFGSRRHERQAAAAAPRPSG